VSGYPVTVTRQQLVDLEACPKGVEDFDKHVPDGVLVIRDVEHHVTLFCGWIAPWEEWAIVAAVLPKIVTTAGCLGTATAGDWGTAAAGYEGAAAAGYGGAATAGNWGTATAGCLGTILIAYYDTRRRTLVGYPGEGGIKADTPYRVVNGAFVEVTL